MSGGMEDIIFGNITIREKIYLEFWRRLKQIPNKLA